MKNKIAILIPQLYWGGMPRVASNLVGRLKDFYEVEFILVNSTMEIREETYGVKINRVYGNKLNKFLNLRKILKKQGYKAVISFGIVDNFLNVLLTPSNTKKIITEHSTKSFDNQIEKGEIKKKIYSFGMKHLYNRADEIVTVSAGISDDLKKNYNIKKTNVIYNIVTTSNISDDLSIDDKDLIRNIRKNNGKILVNAGRITEPKGVLNVIRAMKYLDETYHLIIIGEGPLSESIEKYICKNKLDSRIHIVGFQTNVVSWIKEADFYVTMSWFEGFPTSMIESIMVGTPVISADIYSGPREILSNGEEIDYRKSFSYPVLLKNGVLTERFNAFDSDDINNMIKFEKKFAESIKFAYEQSFNLKLDFINEKETIQKYIQLIEE